MRGRRRRGQRRRQDRLRDGPVRRHHQQARKRRNQEIISIAAGAGGDGLQVQLGGNPIEEVRAEEEGDSSVRDRPARGDRDPAAHLRLGGGDGPADHHRAVRARRRPQPGHARHPRLRHRRLRPAAGGDDRPRRRHRLRALHPHPLPQRPRRGPGAAHGGDRGGRHRRPRRPLRGHHGDHLPDGDVAARPQLPLRGGDGGGAGGPVHDDRGADPAAGAADDRRPPGQPTAHPRPRHAALERRRHPLVPLEPRDPAPPGALGGALRRPAAAPLHPHPVAAARLQRRRHRPRRLDHPRSLRPARGRLRPRLQRALRDGRGAARQGRRRRVDAAEASARRKTSGRRDDAGDAQPGREHRRLPGSTRRPRRRARRRPNCSTTSATT